ncbi:MAG: hypothetical protein GWN62_16975 [Aliifodinibius sp.]|nr:hypothetical protein [Fodinibius sp.]
MVTDQQTTELFEYLGEIRHHLNQDIASDWEVAFQAVLAFCPHGNIREYSDLWLRVCVVCGLAVYKGLSRHHIVQLWVEVYEQEQRKLR